MAKNLVSGPILARFGPNLVPQIFLWVLPLLDVMHCCKLSLYAISRKNNAQTLSKWKKTYFSGLILASLAENLGPKNFFGGFYLY